MRESKQNKTRITSLYPFTGRSVDNLNRMNNYEKEFTAQNSSVSLDIDIKQTPAHCTATPPDEESWCSTSLTGTWIRPEPCPDSYAGCCDDQCCPGYIYEEFLRYPTLYNPPDAPETQSGGYTFYHSYLFNRLIGTQVVLPETGCYAIKVTNSCWGLDYFYGATIGVTLTKNLNGVAGTGRSPTGYIAILGPAIYYTPAPRDIYTIVEAKAGDKIGVIMEAEGFGRCKGWVAGSYLRGVFAVNTTQLSIRLVVKTENVPQYDTADVPLDYEEGTVVDPDAARMTFNRLSNAQAKVV